MELSGSPVSSARSAAPVSPCRSRAVRMASTFAMSSSPDASRSASTPSRMPPRRFAAAQGVAVPVRSRALWWLSRLSSPGGRRTCTEMVQRATCLTHSISGGQIYRTVDRLSMTCTHRVARAAHLDPMCADVIGGPLGWTDLVHADGTMLVKGQVGGLGDPADLDRVGDRTWRRARPGDHLGERRKLGAEGVGKSVHEEVVRCATRKGDPWFGRTGSATSLQGRRRRCPLNRAARAGRRGRGRCTGSSTRPLAPRNPR